VTLSPHGPRPSVVPFNIPPTSFSALYPPPTPPLPETPHGLISSPTMTAMASPTPYSQQQLSVSPGANKSTLILSQTPSQQQPQPQQQQQQQRQHQQASQALAKPQQTPTPSCSPLLAPQKPPLIKTKIPWRRKLILVLVGLPARGKSYISFKLLGYLRWRGLNANLFNVGKARRAAAVDETSQQKVPQSSDYFSPDNVVARTQRDCIAMEVLDVMLDWLESGGDVGIFDATNTTNARRRAVLNHCQTRSNELRLIFVESICDDERVLAANYLVKAMNSPDYKDMPLDKALEDLRQRVANYERIYESISDDELSYIKLHNLASKVICNKIHGQLSHAIAAYLMSIHVQPRPIYFVRAGHSENEQSATSPTALKESNHNGPDGSASSSSSSMQSKQKKKKKACRETEDVAVQQFADRQILKLPEAQHGDHAPDFHIPYAVATAANLDVRGRAFAKRLHQFITHKVEAWARQHPEALQHHHVLGNTAAMQAAAQNAAAEGIPMDHPSAIPAAMPPPLDEAPSTTDSTEASAVNTAASASSSAPDSASSLVPTTTLPTSAAATSNPPEHHLPLVVFTSTLPRAVQTVQALKDSAYIFETQSSLNMMDTGVCSGMTIQQIREKMPEELRKWQKHKFRYRFPLGESQADRAKSLEPLVFELERQRLPVLVVSHMSTLQVLLGFFYGSKRSVDSYYSIWIPQHTVLEIMPSQYGYQSKMHDLSEEACMDDDICEPGTDAASCVGHHHDLGSPQHDEVERFNLQVVEALEASRKASEAQEKDRLLLQQRLASELGDLSSSSASSSSASRVTSPKSPTLSRPASLQGSDRSISITAYDPSANGGGGGSGHGSMQPTNSPPVYTKRKGSIGRSTDVTELGATDFYTDT